ncbi:MAG: hypothetical protein KZQ99_23080 [Candidatus Thiodiazotropha sp. (ex Dulcina madagascariensis)]|nr:hypothetical protein [Candidatus Thiodiazotropha sp. (ex Dulcina madagascariensis)]
MSPITLCFYALYRLKAHLAACLHGLAQWLAPARTPGYYGRRKPLPDTLPGRKLLNTPKPPWVRQELRMKVWMPEEGCRPLAAAFNHRFCAGINC